MRALPEVGQLVVKTDQGDFYELDEQSFFLLEQLDGRASAEEICAAYETRFGIPLNVDDLTEFVGTAGDLGFLEAPPKGERATPAQPASCAPEPAARTGNSLLHFLVRFCDPDRLLAWLAPKLWFFWTPGFVLLATVCILTAALVAWSRRTELAHSLSDALTWRTVVLAWVALAVVTVLHELAHGLTCKRFGGQVRDMGFLLLFFMPCFYANVSDAWLFPKRSQRLWVTFAGGFFELWLWALAVLAWAVAQPGSLPSRTAWLVAVLCGVQTLFNFNPLVKLDGYYLLSDWLGMPNLRERALAQVTARLRQGLWGAPPPPAEPRSGVLIVYGVLSLIYSAALVAVGLLVVARLAGRALGVAGWAGVALLMLFGLRGALGGLFQGEVIQMVRTRWGRTIAWAVGLAAVPVVLSLVPITDRAGGPFRLRPALRVEVRAPVAGFVRSVYADEGSAVGPGTLLAELEMPDLASRAEQKQAEVREARARLRLLQAGPRAEEIDQQRRRVERGTAWRDLAAQDLERARRALGEEEKRLDGLLAQCRAELEHAEDALARLSGLVRKGIASQDEYQAARTRLRVTQGQEEQACAQKRARQAVGTQDAEAELARREKELADDRAKLALLEAGSRPDEIEAELARLARLEEELRHLGRLQERTRVVCRSAGVVVTPRLCEKVGQYLREGDVLAVIEETACLDAEVALPEDESARVLEGQRVSLKVRALPHETFTARVLRIAPTAKAGDPDRPEEVGRVTVSCRLDGPTDGLRPGMSGYARIYSAERSLGGYLLDRAVRFVRTEFWW
jgi:multidrug efflux pump subunit AcrA (membrane-fusion protein)